MTSLVSKLAYWIAQANDNSAGTHPPGYVAGQRWNATASQWQTQDTTDVSNANTWQSRANTAYDSGTWGTGTTWQAHANTAYDSGTWGTGNTWQTDYNNLLNGLNNPEGLTTTAMSWPSLAGHNVNDFNFGTFTLTLPRAGHYLIGYQASGSHTNVGFGVNARFIVGGTAGLTDTKATTTFSNSGTTQFAGGYLADGNFASGQTVTVELHGDFMNAGSASGTIYAHFVPDSTHHN